MSSPVSSTSNPINTIDNADKVDWNDRVGLQDQWSNKDKGWRVDVEWKQTPYGAGVFAKQKIKKGTILRIGRNGKNLLQFRDSAEMRSFCLDAKGTPNQSRISYTSDYFYGFRFDSNDDSSSSMWYGLWVPGNGLNHSLEANTIYQTASDGIDKGIDLVAMTDIAEGSELFDDYRRHGKAPDWAKSFANEFGVSMNFEGCNDFV
eukprot:Awhi_evm1s2104